jgi:VWFA-related protein
MTRRLTTTAALAISLSCVGLFSILAGETPTPQESVAPETTPQPGQDFVIHQNVELVLLDTGVVDHAGNYVAGLPKSAFRVTENGKPCPITIFDNSDLPVTLGILVDESGSMTPRRREVITAAEALIQESNPRDEIFVLNFNDSVRRGLPESKPFSGDIGELKQALEHSAPEGRTALYDAVFDGLAQLREGRRSRKALVLVSDGGDTASTRKRPETLAALERSGATVYAVGLYRPGDTEIDPGFLRHLAKMSGGEAFFPTKPDELTEACRRIAKAIRSRYVIGYRPPDGKRGEMRNVRVHVRSESGENLKVLARSRYRYGEGPSAAPTREEPTDGATKR